MSGAPMIKMKEIKYLVASFDENMDAELFKLISMVNTFRIFSSKPLNDVIGGILSQYALMNKTVLEDKTFENSLLNEGVKLHALQIRGKHDLSNYIKFVDPELHAKFLRYLNSEGEKNGEIPIRIRRVPGILNDRFSSLNFPIGLIVAFTGLCLCLMSKKLTKYNHFSWVRQKWKSFLGIVGLDQQFSACGPSYHLIPDLNVCRNVYAFFKQHHAFRRRLYLGIMKLSWESGLWGNMSRAVLRFSKGLEMNHIVLINTYILQDHPELIRVEELKSEFQKLNTAFQMFLKENIPDEQWPYIQIMSRPSYNIWSNQNFPILNYLAVQIGKRIRPDLGDYRCELSSDMLDVAMKIMSEIISVDTTSAIVRAQSENGSEINNAAVHSENGEFHELLKISDILEKSLYRLAGVRNFNEDDAGLSLVSNSIPCTEIKYFRMPNNSDVDLLNVFCMLNISRVYQSDCLTEVIGGILTLFAAVDSETLSTNDCKMSLNMHGYELREILIESANDLACQFIFENTKLNNLFLKFFDLACSDSIFPSVVVKNNPVVSKLFIKIFLKMAEIPNIVAYIGLYLVPIFKQLSENNYESWLEHKWDTFCRVVGDDHSPYFSELLVPSLKTCISIYSFFHSNFEFRRIIFLKFVELSKLSNLIHGLFLVICQSLKETEINHIYLINRCILQERKHFLKMRELKPELKRFMLALHDMKSKLPSVNDWLYIKILLHPNNVEYLNKNNFPLLIYMAESFRNSINKPKYVGVRKVTEYFKKVKDTAEMYDNFFCMASSVSRIQKFFELNFPNGDLLSSLGDEELKQLTVNSMCLSTCHDQVLGIIPDHEKQEIFDMPIEEVKEEYKHFGLPSERCRRKIADFMSQSRFYVSIFGPSKTVTVSSDSKENENLITSEEEGCRSH